MFVIYHNHKSMEKNNQKAREEILKKIRLGDYELVSKILKDKYKTQTVRRQISGYRTLKQPVIDGFNKLFESREKLLSE